MFKSVLTAAAAIAAFAGSAPAAVTVQFTSLKVGPFDGETLVYDFEAASPALSGSGYGFYTGGNPGVAAPPMGNGSRYLSVLTNGAATYTFANAVTNFGIDYGSIDTFNTLTVNLVGGATQSFRGTQLTNLQPANGSWTAANANGRALYTADAGERIASITLASSGNSFEFDNIGVTNAVPEPGTWALMIGGMGLVGVALRRRRAAGPAAATA